MADPDEILGWKRLPNCEKSFTMDTITQKQRWTPVHWMYLCEAKQAFLMDALLWIPSVSRELDVNS